MIAYNPQKFQQRWSNLCSNLKWQQGPIILLSVHVHVSRFAYHCCHWAHCIWYRQTLDVEIKFKCEWKSNFNVHKQSTSQHTHSKTTQVKENIQLSPTLYLKPLIEQNLSKQTWSLLIIIKHYFHRLINLSYMWGWPRHRYLQQCYLQVHEVLNTWDYRECIAVGWVTDGRFLASPWRAPAYREYKEFSIQ